MNHKDKLCSHYKDILEGTYDCVDRLVLNGYYPLGHSPGGFRTWFRNLKGSDEGLNNTTLIRMAGKFSSRIRAFCKKEDIPVVYFKAGERKHEEAEKLLPTDKNFTGLFAVFVSKAPAMVWDIKEFGAGKIDIRKKAPMSYINHYSFHIIDQKWGHITIKISGHFPFGAQIILNGHEWVERRKGIKKLSVTKEGNCFTSFSDGESLSRIADTLSIQKGQLESVCNRWIYLCLWFGLDQQEQERSGFKYQYSIYQVEYSRNLLFKRGTQLDQMYQNLITLTRQELDIKRLTTIMGKKNRPHNRKQKRPEIEIRIEKPDYNLTIFKIHFGKVTLKLYDKGERILRAEVVVHNARELKCKRSVSNFKEIVSKLNTIMNSFMDNLCYTHVSLLDDGSLKKLISPSKKGTQRLAGVDINKGRTIAVMESVVTLAIKPNGYTAKDVAILMKERMDKKQVKDYSPAKAAYDVRKLRGKGLVVKIGKSRKYKTTKKGMETILAVLVLTQKTMPTILSSINKEAVPDNHEKIQNIDNIYMNIRNEIREIHQQYGLKIAS
ncbi:MAG: hypothetical protein KAR07_00670 [Spirochaetes bacterium]|nr:hypothetical protein [Spirochaetota bacterium]